MVIKQNLEVKSVESYLIYELVNTVNALLSMVVFNRGDRDDFLIQYGKLKEAFHLFMLDIEPDDFRGLKLYKDLKLPSELKVKKGNKGSKSGSSEKTKKRVGKRVGKQLALFFTKYLSLQKSILSRVNISESRNVSLRENRYFN